MVWKGEVPFSSESSGLPNNGSQIRANIVNPEHHCWPNADPGSKMHDQTVLVTLLAGKGPMLYFHNQNETRNWIPTRSSTCRLRGSNSRPLGCQLFFSHFAQFFSSYYIIVMGICIYNFFSISSECLSTYIFFPFLLIHVSPCDLPSNVVPKRYQDQLNAIRIN